MTPAEARALFPVLERRAYLNAGSVGPLSRRTVEAMQAAQAVALERGRGAVSTWESGAPAETELRARIGSLIGVPADNMLLTASTWLFALSVFRSRLTAHMAAVAMAFTPLALLDTVNGMETGLFLSLVALTCASYFFQ